MVHFLARVSFLLLLIPLAANAQIESSFKFNGQNAEVLQAQKNIVVITPEVVDVPSTCSRQVPAGELQICHSETRYDRQCVFIPAERRCFQEPVRSCRQIPRTRQECTKGPDRRVCTPIPVRQVCTDTPSTSTSDCNPGTDRNDTRGSRSCRPTPSTSTRTCTQVGGGESCTTVPGERICRDVTYSEEVCATAYVNRCETIPARNDCRDVAYQVPVCHMEMQYRTEHYACMRKETVDRRTNKVLTNTVNVQILTNGLVEEFPVLVSVVERSRDFSAFNINVSLKKDPSVIVYLKKKTVSVVSESETEIQLESNVVMEVVSRGMVTTEFPAKIISAEVVEKTKKMTVLFEGGISAMGKIDLDITHKPTIGSTNTVASLRSEYPSAEIELAQVGNKVAMKIDLTQAIQNKLKAKKMKLSLSLSAIPRVSGEILNQKKPEASKSYSGVDVSLK